ncbi:MAG: hypothetical protein ACRDK5_02740 [Solirubrobacterales bacterium]
MENWLAQLDPRDRRAVRAAPERDPDLKDEVELLLERLPSRLQRAFLDRFQPALGRAPRPAPAVIEGLGGIIRARRRGRGRGEGES